MSSLLPCAKPHFKKLTIEASVYYPIPLGALILHKVSTDSSLVFHNKIL